MQTRSPRNRITASDRRLMIVCILAILVAVVVHVEAVRIGKWLNPEPRSGAVLSDTFK